MKMNKGSGQLTTRIKLSSGERGYLTTWYLEFYAGSEMTVMATAVRCQALDQLTSRSLVSVVKRVCTSASEKSPKITVYSEKNRNNLVCRLYSLGAILAFIADPQTMCTSILCVTCNMIDPQL